MTMPNTELEWRGKLTPEQYAVLREKGTERPFAGALLHEKRDGTFTCAACGAELFTSETKFESGTGWPSFTEPANRENVELREDRSQGMVRTEVLCKRCGSHLGHVFPDGPGPTGDRYCINSVCLTFEPGTAADEDALEVQSSGEVPLVAVAAEPVDSLSDAEETDAKVACSNGVPWPVTDVDGALRRAAHTIGCFRDGTLDDPHP